MKIFLDTSSLFKLYHKEAGTDELMELFTNNKIEAIFIAEISKLEFDSVVWKKFRKAEINEAQVQFIIKSFEKDGEKFLFINDNKRLKSQAKKLLSKYGKEGLRTLDSIQLSSAISVKSKAEIFITSDKLLQRFFELEGLEIMK